MLLIYNAILTICRKLCYGSRYNVHVIQRISPNANVKLFKHGALTIGRNCELSAGCDIQVHGNGTLHIGAGTYMNRYCIVSAHSNVTIGSGCMFGPGVCVFDNNHRFSATDGVSSDLSSAPITIGNNCWIASNAIILKGANVGDNCVIGAGCIVSGKIPDKSIVRLKQEQTVEAIR